VIRRDGEDLVLAPGEALLTSCAEVAQFVRPDIGQLMCVRLPRKALSGVLVEPDSYCNRRIPAASGALQILLSYAKPLSAMDDLMLSPETSRAVASHVSDLVALAAGASGEAAREAADRGLRAARLREVKASIDARIGPHDFDIEDVAGAIGISPRYVRKLLESEGLSFSRYVVGRRLDRARERLASPRFAHEPISTIAYDVGFGDLSYFNRMFRRRFDRTPSDVRANPV
jgi:AraC-like DNA-binding protein